MLTTIIKILEMLGILDKDTADSLYQPKPTAPMVTHTGKFVIPLVLRRQEDFNIQNVLTGDNTSKQLPSAHGIGISEFYYDENQYSNADERLITLSVDDVEYCGQIYILNCAGLTYLRFLKLIASIGLSLGDLASYCGIFINVMPKLETLSFDELVHATNFILMAVGLSTTNGVAISAPKFKYVSNAQRGQGSFNIVNCKINGELSFPELESIAKWYIQQITGATAVKATKLKRCIGDFIMTTMFSILETDFDSLEDVMGNFSIKDFGSATNPITILDFHSAKTLRGNNPTTFTGVNALALDFSGMVEYTSGVTFAGTNKFSSVVLGTKGTLKKIGSVILPMTGSYGLDQTSVDNLFELLASLDGVTNGTSSFGGKTLTLTGGVTATPSFHLSTISHLLDAFYKFDGSGTTATVTWPSHGYSNGDLITISGINSPFTGTFFITYINSNQFSFTIPQQQQAVTGTGTATMKKANSTTDTYYYKQLLLNRGCTVTNNGAN